MLEHDPAGWSKVAAGGKEGYIRSDFLKFPVGNAPAAFKTTIKVNFRVGPSTSTNAISTLNIDTNVEVLEHDPAGWSKVRLNGTVGYINSSYLAWPSQNAQQGMDAGATAAATEPVPAPAPTPEPVHAPEPEPAQSQPTEVYRTSDTVNFRSGPSTDTSIIKTLSPGVVVDMIEYNPDGWSKLKFGENVGYIRSDFLRVDAGGVNGGVELLSWSAAKDIVPKGTPMKIVDVRTGLSFELKCFSKGGHADVEPPTQADTDTILKTRNGAWAWAPRPVWVTTGGRTIAAALNGQPHSGSTISNNGMNGHLCLHFNGTVTNSKTYQRDLNNAVIEAWNAAK